MDLARLGASFKWEVRAIYLVPLGIFLSIFYPAGKEWFSAVTAILIFATDIIFSVVVVAAFLRPIQHILQNEPVPARHLSLRSNGASRKLERTKRTTLAGVSLAVASSSLLYLAIILYNLLVQDTFHSSPWLNMFVFPGNADSICNDVGLLLASGMAHSAWTGGGRRSNRISAKNSRASSANASVTLARSHLAALTTIPVSTSFTPPQQQPRGVRLKLISQILQEELFESTDDPRATREMNNAVADVIDNEFAPMARVYFDECVEAARQLVAQMREQYHEVRKGHLSIYADTLQQIRQEPTYPELQRRSDQLVEACVPLGRPQQQQSTTLSDLLNCGEAVSKRYDTLMDTVASKTGSTFHVAPRKGLVRITEKLAMTIGANNGKPQRVCDLVRGAIECVNFTTMMNSLRLLCDLDTKLQTTGETGGITESICITRSKGRFGQPTSGGWGDIMINFYFASDERKHICELQLVHMQLYNVRKNMGAHATYAIFRAALELLKMLEEDPEEGSDGKELAALVWAGEGGDISSVETALGGTMSAATGAFQTKLANLESLVSSLEAQHKNSEALKEELEANFKARSEAQDAEITMVKSTFKARSEAQDAEMAMLKSKLFAVEAKLARQDPPSTSCNVARALI
jgi:hypothetical protein